MRTPPLRALLCLGAVALACTRAEPPHPPRPPTVGVATPERRTFHDSYDLTGTTRAPELVDVRARVAGRLEEILFEPGSFVEEGDELFAIERETYQAAFDEASASHEAAQSQLASAASDLERVELAIRSDAVSKQDADRARAARDQAAASVRAAEARLARAKIDLDYTRVRSPLSGQVGRNLVDRGNLVGWGEPTRLTTVTKVQPIHVYFDAPERAVLRMLALRKQGLEQSVTVMVATAADEGFPHVGEVDYVSNTVDAGTGTIEVRATLPNEDLLLFPGLFVRIRALGPEREGLVVRERALGADLGGRYVYVLGEGDVVEQRYVTLGPVLEGGAVVVEDGLQGDERYVVDGLLSVRPGKPVTPEQAGD